MIEARFFYLLEIYTYPMIELGFIQYLVDIFLSDSPRHQVIMKVLSLAKWILRTCFEDDCHNERSIA